MARTPEEIRAKSEECHKRLHDERIGWGVCIQCGKPLVEETTLHCKGCLARRAEQRERDRAKILDRQRKRIADHRARGLCLYCDTPAVTKTMCDYHRKYYAANIKERRRIKAKSKEM